MIIYNILCYSIFCLFPSAIFFLLLPCKRSVDCVGLSFFTIRGEKAIILKEMPDLQTKRVRWVLLKKKWGNNWENAGAIGGFKKIQNKNRPCWFPQHLVSICNCEHYNSTLYFYPLQYHTEIIICVYSTYV